MANHFFQPQSSKISVDEFSFADILKGKRVKLTLKTASYLGVVLRVNPNKSVALTDVVDVKDGRRFPGVKLFFGNEIVNVESCGETNSNDGEICITESEGILKVEEFQPYRNNIISDDDNDEYVKFQVIDEFTEKFGLAVMHIRRQDVIGVAAEGVEPFQQGRLCWLQIATGNQVHLFDILLLGAQAFKNGLAAVLQSRRILKVVHDCRGVVSSLQAQFGVNLRTVFDTQVADVMCFHSDTGGYLPHRVSTLQEVVSLHLGVPSSRLSSLRMKTRLTQEEREILYTRPCPLPMLKVMALAVVHLQPLRMALLDAMMADYVARVDAYLGNVAREPGAVEHIAMGDVLELPRELRELEHIRKDRQRHAINRFNVTQSGLLVRFNPPSKTPPITKPRPQTPPIPKPRPQTPPITKPRPQTPPITTPLSQTPPITKPLSQTPPITAPLPQTPPITKPLPQTPPITKPLPQTPPITTPSSNTPPQTMPLLKTAPPAVEASRVPVPRMQADGANRAPHADPPPIAGAVGLLHVEGPANGPQVARASSLRPSALTPAVAAPAPPTAVLGPAPPLAVLGPAPPLAVLGPAPPLAVLGPAPSPAVLGPAPPLAVLGPAPPPAVLGPAPPPPVMGPAPPLAVLGPAPPLAVLGPAPSPAVLGPAPSPAVLGPAPPLAVLGPAPPPAVLGPAPPPAVLGPAPPPPVMGPAPPLAVLGPAPPPAVLGPAPPPAAAPRPSLSPSSPGMRELLLGIIGRGRPLSEAPQAPPVALPSLGRGLMLQKALASSPVSVDGFPPGASRGADVSQCLASPRRGHP